MRPVASSRGVRWLAEERLLLATPIAVYLVTRMTAHPPTRATSSTF